MQLWEVFFIHIRYSSMLAGCIYRFPQTLITLCTNLLFKSFLLRITTLAFFCQQIKSNILVHFVFPQIFSEQSTFVADLFVGQIKLKSLFSQTPHEKYSTQCYYSTYCNTKACIWQGFLPQHLICMKREGKSLMIR